MLFIQSTEWTMLIGWCFEPGNEQCAHFLHNFLWQVTNGGYFTGSCELLCLWALTNLKWWVWRGSVFLRCGVVTGHPQGTAVFKRWFWLAADVIFLHLVWVMSVTYTCNFVLIPSNTVLSFKKHSPSTTIMVDWPLKTNDLSLTSVFLCPCSKCGCVFFQIYLHWIC